MSFDKGFIETVREANNIVDVAKNYLALKQKGHNFWCRCPYHSEKTASFAINNQNQAFYCFGCNTGGNIFTLIMKMENLNFPEAVEFLARRANIPMPKSAFDKEYELKAQRRERILSALDAARDYYCKNLVGITMEQPQDMGKMKIAKGRDDAIKYLKERGVTDELIRLFHIGYSSSWDGVIKELKVQGFSEEDMLDAKIVGQNERGKIYDAQFERITFAITDIYGNCIGFSGRTMSNDKEIAKYKNTADSLVFDKGGTLYGIDVMKEKTKSTRYDNIIVVEGNLDEISMIKHGFCNTVAFLGTAITEKHAKLFKRFADNVVLLLDGDAAGQKASLRAIPILLEEKLNIKVITLRDNLDPDEYLQKFGADKLRQEIQNGKNHIEFELNCLARECNLKNNDGKTKFVKGAIDILSRIEIDAEREIYLPNVAKFGGTTADAIRNSMKNLNRKTEDDLKDTIYSGVYEHNKHKITTANQKAELFVIASIAHKKDYALFVDGQMKAGGHFCEGIIFEEDLFNKVFELFKGGGNLGAIYNFFNEDDICLLRPVIEYQFLGNEDEQYKQWQDCVLTLKKAVIDREIKAAIAENDIQKINKLKKKKKDIK